MRLEITVNGEPLVIDETTTAAALFSAIEPDVSPGAPGYWLLAREDGAHFVENPQQSARPVIELFDGAEPVPLFLEQPRRCRHGSPEVRNRGFLCGWC